MAKSKAGRVQTGKAVGGVATGRSVTVRLSENGAKAINIIVQYLDGMNDEAGIERRNGMTDAVAFAIVHQARQLDKAFDKLLTDQLAGK